MIQNQPLLVTIKPSIKKVLLKNLVEIFSAVAVIALLFIVYEYTVGLYLLVQVFEEFGITINPITIISYSILGVFGISLLVLVLSFLSTRMTSYKIYPDKIIVNKNLFIILKNSMEIPYNNITRLTSDTEGIFNKLFKTGTIVLELSAMKESQIKLDFLDNIERAGRYLYAVIQKYKSIQQAQFTQDYRVRRIVNTR